MTIFRFKISSKANFSAQNPNVNNYQWIFCSILILSLKLVIFYYFSSFFSKNFISCADCGPEISLLHEPGPGQRGHQHHGGPQQQDVRAQGQSRHQADLNSSDPVSSSLRNDTNQGLKTWSPYPYCSIYSYILFQIFCSEFFINKPYSLFRPLHTKQTHTHTYIN
jgi:hypothetical protein